MHSGTRCSTFIEPVPLACTDKWKHSAVLCCLQSAVYCTDSRKIGSKHGATMLYCFFECKGTNKMTFWAEAVLRMNKRFTITYVSCDSSEMAVHFRQCLHARPTLTLTAVLMAGSVDRYMHLWHAAML